MRNLRKEKADVVVVGGGAAGMSAAVAAARLGGRVILVECYGFLGGAASNSLVLAYCGFFQRGTEPVLAVGGIGKELLDELETLGQPSNPIVSKSGNWIVMLDPEAVKFAFDRLCGAAGVEVLLHSRLVAAEVCDGRVKAVTLADHAGEVVLEAESFVDASGEATLSHLAGVPMRVSSLAGDKVQPASLPVRIGGVAPGAALDHKRMAEIIKVYNETAITPVSRPDGGVISRLPVSGDVWWMTVDLETGGLEGADLSRVEQEARRQAWRNLSLLKQLPGFEQAYLVSTGPQIGIRETRRPKSSEDVTEAILSAGQKRPDGIGRAAWPMEVHEAPGRVRFAEIGGDGYADIPPGAIRALGMSNLLLAGRVAGADSVAYGSLRVMGTAFATGHAAGITAALQADGGDMSTDGVRQHLRLQRALC
ncbi:FAD-dependent oxidoreductase [Roseibium suaedae]|uniref:FAD dependent oxidoreductase n=1 Tax=Roseibium suaedae TaxID=735517 RepID=A0A1M7BHL8_9HYPH|nr:FAD-dependent oxidoreductase [Roseibium suaedae]SHL54444.1 FAD dependent oxidoreductase [Roseibium suaedae]